MHRRSFIQSSASVLASSAALRAQSGGGQREYYLLRRYHLTNGDGRKLTDSYLKDALLPSLNRMGITPVGVFATEIGPTAPSLYVLMPSMSLETLVTSDLKLMDDQEYRKAGAAFLDVPAKDPAYVRIESSLMIAFSGKPKLTVPPVTASHGSRVFELRTYESPTDQDHQRKVEMFNSGEFDIFARAGFWQIFYGDTLVGANQPNLTYMIGFADLPERNAKWKAFMTDPEWQKLTHSQRFSFEDIVSNVTNSILGPTAFSQI